MRALTGNTTYIVLTAIYLIISGLAFYLINTSSMNPCIVQDITDRQKSTVEFIDGLVDLQMTLSTGVIGLGIALLFGLQGNIRITRIVAFLSFLSIASLAISVLYGIWWKMSIANLWFNECLDLVASDIVQNINEAHFYYMMLGVLFIGILVSVLTFERLGVDNAGGGGNA